MDLAAGRGLLLGVAPDTVLGPGWQTAKRAIQAGVIGTPLSAVTSFQSQGPDWFHPGPEFLFAKGAGRLFDIGPYYLSALVHLLGPISQVIAVGAKVHEVREHRHGSVPTRRLRDQRLASRAHAARRCSAVPSPRRRK